MNILLLGSHLKGPTFTNLGSHFNKFRVPPKGSQGPTFTVCQGNNNILLQLNNYKFCNFLSFSLENQRNLLTIMALNDEIDVLKAELSEKTGQNEFRNLPYELKNVKKKNNEMEKRICILEKENAALKNELALVDGQPSDQDISDALAAFHEFEIKKVVRNRTLYQRLDRNLKDFVVDPFFYKVQKKLFRRRTRFFYQTYVTSLNYYCNGCNDYCEIEDNLEATVPHQVTKNFDEVATKYLKIPYRRFPRDFEPVFFKRDGIF